MRYLMVVPVACHPLPDGGFATEGAFAAHLEMLFARLRPRFDEFVLAAPTMAPADYQRRRASLGHVAGGASGFHYAPLNPSGVGVRAYWLRHLWPTLRAIWREVGRADLIHAGASMVFIPREISALVMGVARGVRTICVCDIDERRSPAMNLSTGRWSRGEYLRTQYVYQPLFDLQLAFAARFCSLSLLKGRALVEDFGRGRPNVREILDSAFSSEHLVPPARLEAKLAGSARPGARLELVYFGRLTAYKGVDRCLRAVARAVRERGAALRFRILGSGEERAALEALARELGIAADVEFKGDVPFGPALFEILYGCDLLLAAPLSEDTPRSALDALAAGVPILGYDTYYYRDLARCGAVDVVPWEDVGALAERIAFHAGKREWLQAAARRAREFAAQQTQEIWLDRRIEWTLALFDGRS